MKPVFILFISLLFAQIVTAQGVIMVQHGNTSTVETRLDSAVAHAQNGDYIYLPGGFFNGPLINIDKKLYIIGAGYHPDSSNATSATILSIPINFIAGSDSSYLTGIYSNTSVSINTSNITIQRCFLDIIAFGSDNYSNILITENILQGSTSIYVPWPNQLFTNTKVIKNILFGRLMGNSLNGCFNGMFFKNNDFLFNYDYYNNNGYISASFENNIFLLDQNYFLRVYSGFPVNNNLFVTGNNNQGWNSTNYFNEPVGNVFNNYVLGTATWNHTQDFHLKPGCHGIGLGSDGTDVGIYGTNSPFKEGGIPFNPHFQSVAIPASTGANGTLNINITVKAQDH